MTWSSRPWPAVDDKHLVADAGHVGLGKGKCVDPTLPEGLHPHDGLANFEVVGSHAEAHSDRPRVP